MNSSKTLSGAFDATGFNSIIVRFDCAGRRFGGVADDDHTASMRSRHRYAVHPTIRAPEGMG